MRDFKCEKKTEAKFFKRFGVHYTIPAAWTRLCSRAQNGVSPDISFNSDLGLMTPGTIFFYNKVENLYLNPTGLK